MLHYLLNHSTTLSPTFTTTSDIVAIKAEIRPLKISLCHFYIRCYPFYSTVTVFESSSGTTVPFSPTRSSMQPALTVSIVVTQGLAGAY